MINVVIVRGNLTKDPELRYSPSGVGFCKFSLALNRKYKSGNELKEEVSFIEIVSFGKQGEACAEYLTKGSDVLIEGRIKQERWEQEDKSKRSKIVIMATAVNFLTRSKGETTTGSVKTDAGHHAPEQEEDIPF